MPAAAFEPAPEVDSAVLRLMRRPEPVVPAGDERERFIRVVQAGFRERRKKIHNGLGRQLGIVREELDAAFASCEIDSERRPQTLSVEEWACLARGLVARL